jgi:hypothetical protein
MKNGKGNVPSASGASRKLARPSANGATKTLASPTPSWGRGTFDKPTLAKVESQTAQARGSPPTKEEAPASTGATNTSELGYQEPNGAQAQSHNGSKPAQISIVKIEGYIKGQFFTKVPNAVLLDKNLAGLPAWIFCLALSKSRDWKLRSKWLRQEYGLTRLAVRAAMKRLAEADLVKLKTVRLGQRFDRWWMVRAWVDLPWPDESSPSENGSSQGVISQPFTNDPILTYRPIPKNKGKGSRQSRKHPQFRWRVPKRPYPKTKSVMCRTLNALGIETDIDYDGKFFEQMTASGWVIPGTGERVYDWVATYQARLESIYQQMSDSL